MSTAENIRIPESQKITLVTVVNIEPTNTELSQFDYHMSGQWKKIKQESVFEITDGWNYFLSTKKQFWTILPCLAFTTGWINVRNRLFGWSIMTDLFRTCNNEIVKMQRLDLDKMKQLKGTEFVLFSHQEPYLYVIRKQRRETPTLAIPQTTYYVINGTIFQSPNVYSVLSSRLLKVIYHMQQAFRTTSNYKKFDLNTGYVWDFTQSEGEAKPIVPKTKDTKQIEDSQRVDKIIASLYAQYAPPKPTPSPAATQPGTKANNTPVATPSPSLSTTNANANNNNNNNASAKRKQDTLSVEAAKKQKTL